MDLNYWAYVTEVWLIIGLVLIIADVFLGFNFFVLPAGIAALIIGALVYAENNALFEPFVLFETWRTIILSFAALSLASVGLLKFFLQRNSTTGPDVNNY